MWADQRVKPNANIPFYFSDEIALWCAKCKREQHGKNKFSQNATEQKRPLIFAWQ